MENNHNTNAPEIPETLQVLLENFGVGELGAQQEWFKGLAEDFNTTQLKALEQELNRRKQVNLAEWEKLVNLAFIIQQALRYQSKQSILLPTPKEIEALREARAGRVKLKSKAKSEGIEEVREVKELPSDLKDLLEV